LTPAVRVRLPLIGGVRIDVGPVASQGDIAALRLASDRGSGGERTYLGPTSPTTTAATGCRRP